MTFLGKRYFEDMYIVLYLTCILSTSLSSLVIDPSKVPVVFVYTLVPRACYMGLPRHMVAVLEQAHRSYRNSSIIMISNFKECNSTDPSHYYQSMNNLSYVHNIDSVDIISNRTKTFYDLSGGIYHRHSDPGYKPGLWVTSTLRFFILEDLMHTYKFKELLHIESDNMIYGPWENTIIPELRYHYKNLAATRLNFMYVTASVFWVATVKALTHLTEYLTSLGKRDSMWIDYVNHLRRIPGSAKGGGLEQDANGRGGIKPAFVNEMSMLSFYATVEKHRLQMLPIMPSTYTMEDRGFNKSDFAHGGDLVGGSTGDGIYDPNSWGQYLGGTGTGRPQGFIDTSHIIGNALKWHACTVRMLCDVRVCETAPYVRCGYSPTAADWTPLYNLHVHSKRTSVYLSEPCPCNTTLPA